MEKFGDDDAVAYLEALRDVDETSLVRVRDGYGGFLKDFEYNEEDAVFLAEAYIEDYRAASGHERFPREMPRFYRGNFPLVLCSQNDNFIGLSV